MYFIVVDNFYRKTYQSEIIMKQLNMLTVNIISTELRTFGLT